MSSCDYHLRTVWQVQASIWEVAAVLADTESLPRWFPACVLGVRMFEAGDADGTSRLVELRTKGWMPHTMRFVYRVTAVTYPTGFELAVEGDFKGRLVCLVSEDTGRVRVEFDWRVSVAKPFVRRLSWALRPIFVSNHLWVVARGQESLQLELDRRCHGADEGALPQPPGPTFPHGPLSAYLTSRVWSRAPLLPPQPIRRV